jgi:hypothetical protein
LNLTVSLGAWTIGATAYTVPEGIFIGEGSIVYTVGPGKNSVKIPMTVNPGTTLWARTVTAGPNTSQVNAVAVDGDGNVYAADKVILG